jgi:hypothetical protein
LIRNLYPVGKVSEAVVVKLVGSLGHGRAKPSYTVQAALLKWVVMTYDILENKLVLAQLYSVLFNLLDTIAIRYFTEKSTTQVTDLQQNPAVSRAVPDHGSETCPPFQNPGSVCRPSLKSKIIRN